MKESTISKLTACGFRRWQKNGMDRLYINSTAAGLELEYYKSGNVSGAWLNGERISNSRGRAYKDGKNYIDVNSGKVCACCDEIAENIKAAIEKASAE